MYLFTVQGLSDHISNRDAISQQLLQARKERTDYLSRIRHSDSGNEHISSEHHELDRQLSTLEQRLLEFNDQILKSVIVEIPKTPERLGVGLISTIQETDEEGEVIGSPERYLVGGFNSTDMKASPLPIVSYNAPIIACFFGRTVDLDRDPTPIILRGKKRFYKLIRLELPAQEATPLRLVS